MSLSKNLLDQCPYVDQHGCRCNNIADFCLGEHVAMAYFCPTDGDGLAWWSLVPASEGADIYLRRLGVYE